MIQSIPSAASVAPGGAVGGASNLTTAGAVPYVASAGVLTQDATAFFWDAASDRITLGNAMAGTGVASRAEFSHASVFGTTSYALLQSSAGQTTVNTATGQPIYFAANNSVIGMFAPTTGNLLIGTTSDDGSNKLQVAGSGIFAGNLTVSNTGTGGYLRIYDNTVAAPTPAKYITNASGQLRIYNNAYTTSLLSLADSGNLTVYGTADNGYRLDVTASGSSGTLRVYDQTVTTGSTSLVVRAGAGQSGSLQSWQDSGGSALFRVTATGDLESLGKQLFMTNSGYTLSNVIVAPELDLASGRLLRWSSTTDAAASKDLSFSRNTASIAQLGDGGANANGYLKLRGIQSSGLTVSGLPTASAYAGMMIYVTDANATTIGSIVAGGGSNKVMVWSDGTNWKIYAS